MPTPLPVGRVRFTLPRAVQVREPDEVKVQHSAVHGTIAIYTDSISEAQTVIDRWEDIMQAVNEKVTEMLSPTE